MQLIDRYTPRALAAMKRSTVSHCRNFKNSSSTHFWVCKSKLQMIGCQRQPNLHFESRAPDKVRKIDFNWLYMCHFFTESYVWPLVRIVSSRQFLQVVKHWIRWRNRNNRNKNTHLIWSPGIANKIAVSAIIV